MAIKEQMARRNNFLYRGSVFGPAKFQDIRRSTRKNGLVLSPFSELINIFYNKLRNKKSKFYENINSNYLLSDENEDHHNNLIRKLEEHTFWANTAALYTTKGVYIQDFPENKIPYLRNVTRVYMNEKDLEEKVRRGDPDVRFVEYGSFESDNIKTPNLTKHNFILALARKEGTRKLQEMAKRYDEDEDDDSTYLFSLETLPDIFKGKPQTRLIALGYWKTDIGSVAGLHINALIEEDKDDLDIDMVEYSGRYGIGILKH